MACSEDTLYKSSSFPWRFSCREALSTPVHSDIRRIQLCSFKELPLTVFPLGPVSLLLFFRPPLRTWHRGRAVFCVRMQHRRKPCGRITPAEVLRVERMPVLAEASALILYARPT